MKKDIYPDVRIEIISEGLTNKILGKTKDAAPVVYGEEKPKGENLPNIDSKGKNKEMGGLLQVTNKKPTYTSIVKEVIQELRKDAHDKEKPAAQTQNMVKEAIFELRKQPEGQYGQFQPGGRTKTPLEGGTASIGNPEAEAARDASKRAQAEQRVFPSGVPTPYGGKGFGEATIASEEAKLQSGGTDSGYGSGIGPGYRPSGFRLPAGQRPDPVDIAEDKEGSKKDFNVTAISDLAAQQAAPVSAAPTGGAGKKEDKAPVPTSVGGPDVDEDVLEGRSGDAPYMGPSAMVGATSGTEGTKDVDATAASGDSAKKIEAELELGPRANPEITRPTNPKDSSKLLPKFGSSGYFDAIVDLGENRNQDFYGVKNITEFLSLYTQNSPAGQFKAPEGDLTNLFAGPKTEKAYIKKAVSNNPFKTSLKKQSPPMAMTMNRPPNMGVGQQQPVVTGAGTMKADVAANKPKAAPARTKAPRRAAGSIEQRKEKAYIARQAQKALIKSGMVWDSINKQWVPTRG